MSEQRGKATVSGLLVSLCVVAGWVYLRLHNNSGDHTRNPQLDSSSSVVRTAAAAQYDYFLLSLSWSPSYCLTHGDDRAQCSKGYGFVLHGLWP
jgi:ribonuclease I